MERQTSNGADYLLALPPTNAELLGRAATSVRIMAATLHSDRIFRRASKVLQSVSSLEKRHGLSGKLLRESPEVASLKLIVDLPISRHQAEIEELRRTIHQRVADASITLSRAAHGLTVDGLKGQPGSLVSCSAMATYVTAGTIVLMVEYKRDTALKDACAGMHRSLGSMIRVYQEFVRGGELAQEPSDSSLSKSD